MEFELAAHRIDLATIYFPIPLDCNQDLFQDMSFRFIIFILSQIEKEKLFLTAVPGVAHKRECPNGEQQFPFSVTLLSSGLY